MGATYTRQSTYSDGDIITAAHTNDEFNQLLAAFASGTGHTHDGTTAEGGPITKLLGNTLTFGAGTAGTDITITFDGEDNDGVLKWMEDEDYFEFSDDILIASTEKIQFRDTAISINSSTDGQLDLIADTEIQIAATTIDINGNVDISGTLTIGSAGISEAELEILDGATVTTAELNIMDGDTSATSTTVADADRVVMNDNGTMVQVAVTDLAAYFDDEITAMPNLVTTAATTVGALDSGSITSGFGNIDTGSSTITTTGLITGGSLDIDDVVINGTTIGHTDDTDLITLADGIVTVAGEISVTTLDIGGTNVTASAADINLIDGITNGTVIASKAIITDANKDISGGRNITISGELDAATLDISGNADIDGTLEADAITVDGTALDEFISDTVGAMVGSNTETGVTVSYDDSDNTLDFVLGTAQTTIESLKNTSLVIGRDDDNLIKFGTDNQIIFEVSGGDNVIFKASGEIEASSLDISGDADIDGTLEADAITVNGTALNTVIAGVTVTNATTAAVATTVTISDNESTDEDNAIIFTSGGDVDGGNIGLESDGDLTYNPSTGRLTATQLSGTLQTAAQGNITSLGTLTTLTVDNVIINGSTIGHTGDTDLMTVASGVLTVAGEVDATSLDISGDADIDGTLEADAITVNGTALNTVIGNEATALAIALG
jgi:cytoskeletal protein CcmA (bactofilin family)